MIPTMGNRLTSIPATVCALLILVALYPQSNAYAAGPASIERDITYATADGIDLKLDLCWPSAGPGPFPALVLIHSGSWGLETSGTKAECGYMLQEAATRGYVAAAVEHRLLAFDWSTRTLKHRFPDQVYDVKCAVRWLRANSKRYNIDSGQIGAVGWSSGGHLALMLALTDVSDRLEGDCGDGAYSSRIQAAVSSAGPTELASLYSVIPAVIAAFLGGTPDKLPEVYVKASPLTYVTKDDPPILLINGDMDTTVPVQQAEILDAKLTAVGVPHTLVVKKGYGHVALWDEQEVWEFLDDNLHP